MHDRFLMVAAKPKSKKPVVVKRASIAVTIYEGTSRGKRIFTVCYYEGSDREGPTVAELIGDDRLNRSHRGLGSEDVLREEAPTELLRLLLDETQCGFQHIGARRYSGGVEAHHRPQSSLKTTRSNSEIGPKPSSPRPPA